jgi:2,3-dihydroxybenzoate decarboxylase
MSQSTEPPVDPKPARIRKVALEEHFMVPAFIPYLRATSGNISAELFARAVGRLGDFEGRRLEEMDQHRIDYAVLSLAGPGVQIEPDTHVALREAARVNDQLAEQIARHPDRFGGFGHVAMQDPLGAADEMERCMTALRFHGVMINGQTLGHYLDEPQYDPFWERAEALRAPVYIHPGNPVAQHVSYAGHPVLVGPTWSWTVETATHALRLVFGGVFDRFPNTTVLLGHMGETLPYLLWRLDSRFRIGAGAPKLKRNPSDYIRDNIAVTTSGVASFDPLRCALSALGEDRVMFSVDYPFEDTAPAADWMDTVPLGDALRRKVAHANAEALLRLDTSRLAK